MNTYNNNLIVSNILADEIAMEIYTEWQMGAEQRPTGKPVRWLGADANIGDNWPVFYLSTDLDSVNDVQERGAAFGFEIQILFPRDGLPISGRGLIVALDELLRDARGRQAYFGWLKAQTLPLPTVVLSNDFHLELPTVVRPGLMLACRLDDDVFRALRDGHVYLPVTDTNDQEHKAA